MIDEKLTLHFISAPNIFTGGPLTILISCLESIPSELRQESSRVVVICGTHAYRNISLPPGAYPLCLPLSRTSWLIRLYYERIGFFVLTSLCNVHTWLSLHDFTSNVKAKIRVTYYHNPAPFWTPQFFQAILAPGLLLWKFFYFPLVVWGLDRNDALIVQQYWIKHEFTKRFPDLNVLVLPPIAGGQLLPAQASVSQSSSSLNHNLVFPNHPQSSCPPPPGFIFFYPCIPRIFKNIELAIESVLEANRAGFSCSLLLTITGDENLYSRFLRWRYSKLPFVKFIGYQTRFEMDALYRSVDALLFTSLLETWGLPLSEAQFYRLPIVAIDLPYVRETANGYPLLFLSGDKKVLNLSSFYDVFKNDTLAKLRTSSLASSILVSEGYSQIDWNCLWQAVASPCRPFLS